MFKKSHVVALLVNDKGHRTYIHVPTNDDGAMASEVKSAQEEGYESVGLFPLQLQGQEQLLDALVAFQHALGANDAMKVQEAVALLHTACTTGDVGVDMLVARIFECGRRSAAIA